MIAWMKENVYFVFKESDPSNVPQARPIQNFCDCQAQKFKIEYRRLPQNSLRSVNSQPFIITTYKDIRK